MNPSNDTVPWAAELLDGQRLGDLGLRQFPTRLDEERHSPAAQVLFDRRLRPRTLLSRPATLYPVHENKHPGMELRGEVLDIGPDGVGVLLDRHASLPTRNCVVGIAPANGPVRFATIEIRSTRLLDDGLRVGGVFLQGEADPLDPAAISYHLDTMRLRLSPSIDQAILQKWVALGVVRKCTLDYVLSCPRCQALPTFRQGCGACGCPAPPGKLDAGCDECESAEPPTSIGECLMCGLRFLGSDAAHVELTHYLVERLSPALFMGDYS